MLAVGAFAQGGVLLDNKNAAHGITTGVGDNFYNGSAGLEFWYLNGSSFNLSSINGASSSAAAYAALSANGFTLATSFVNTSIALGGFGLGGLNIPGVTPAGSTITLAVAAWKGSGNAFGSGDSGVLAFYQPTVDYTASPPPLPSDLTAAMGAGGATGGFNTQNLVLVPIPEPSSFALAGLGAAALLIFRRRK